MCGSGHQFIMFMAAFCASVRWHKMARQRAMVSIQQLATSTVAA
jgi:hypothetical protein